MIVRLAVNIANFETLDLTSSEHNTLDECQKDIKTMIDFYANYFPKVMTYKRIFDKDNLLNKEGIKNGKIMF